MKNSCLYVDLQVSVSHLGGHLEFLKFLIGDRVAPGGLWIWTLQILKTHWKQLCVTKFQVLQRICVWQPDYGILAITYLGNFFVPKKVISADFNPKTLRVCFKSFAKVVNQQPNPTPLSLHTLKNLKFTYQGSCFYISLSSTFLPIMTHIQ